MSKPKPIYLAPRQIDTLTALATFVSYAGYPPSIVQLCKLLGVTSTSTVHFHLTALKKAGVVDWDTSGKRTLHITEKAHLVRPNHERQRGIWT